MNEEFTTGGHNTGSFSSSMLYPLGRAGENELPQSMQANDNATSDLVRCAALAL